ncbi:MAG: hypothetical protein Q9187_007710 [Circinaria calcarea]
MSVELDPPELGFRRPFTHEVTQVLRLRNPNSDPVAFKVKYLVVYGVLLQAMKEDPPLDARCRDKFLVQSVAIAPDQELPNITTIWQNIEKIAKSSIQERKIRVTFLPGNESTSTPQRNKVNGMHMHEDAPPAYASPSPQFGSPAPDSAALRDRSMEPSYSDSKSLASPPTALGTASSSISNAATSVNQSLQEQYDAAKEKIATLTRQVEEQGLRQRKSDAVNQDSRERITAGTTGMGIQQQPADGVPVQIVAALCLLSFLLAYFFF